MIVSLIAAMAENRVIGSRGSLPWHLPKDMRRFKTLTTDHAVVMGRKTFETLTQPLPQRRNIVITSNREYRAAGAEVVHGLDEALALVGHEEEVFVAGGGQVYRLALPHASRIYLTVVHATYDGDAFFPEFPEGDWLLVSDHTFPTDERHAVPFSFREYHRPTPSRGVPVSKKKLDGS
ncbi:MAG: dihydrofolate reductase [Gemmatimonadota bacterium]|nr:dihydrofolate reductase [Gemmatimonadota bacterium]MDH3366385.1 dihydrofolate reductase [Gemmatimonadota bacterium]MDH3477571.1 dihydrofolate reductase [Gemmatimonadota bacterium]MDH3571216.1 dihydrofolate reductase [Gemmatimonadota bacterium]MDH5549235.1 dihydrofolate reductase [Gemmatimonadota bacterium]